MSDLDERMKRIRNHPIRTELKIRKAINSCNKFNQLAMIGGLIEQFNKLFPCCKYACWTGIFYDEYAKKYHELKPKEEKNGSN